MLDGKRVAVVVPAFDEEQLVGETIRGIPEFVDRIIVVDDGRVIENGTHAELLLRGTQYARMWAAAEGEPAAAAS